MKLVIDTINNDDTDWDTDGVDILTMEEVENESVSQKLQNNVGMQCILSTHCHSHAQPCTLTHTPVKHCLPQAISTPHF